MEPSPVRPEDLDELVAFIVSQQVDPARNVTYLGADVDGVKAEIEALEPPWVTTARVIRDGRGAIAGAVLVAWDHGGTRAWIHGPWVAGDAWSFHPETLLDAAAALVPPAITELEVSGELANTRLAALAESRGWQRGSVSHAFVADDAVVAAWPLEATVPVRTIRLARPEDVDPIRPLHDAEFPNTYYSADQLVARAAEGTEVVLVAVGADDDVVGYAAGQVHTDGEGFIDFMVVAESARGLGAGRLLLTTLTRQLLDQSTRNRVCLVVQDERTAAQGLYAGLGFHLETSFFVYRTTNWRQ